MKEMKNTPSFRKRLSPWCFCKTNLGFPRHNPQSPPFLTLLPLSRRRRYPTPPPHADDAHAPRPTPATPHASPSPFPASHCATAVLLCPTPRYRLVPLRQVLILSRSAASRSSGSVPEQRGRNREAASQSWASTRRLASPSMGLSWRSAPTHNHRLVLPRGCRRPELPPVHESWSVSAQMNMNASCSSMLMGISEETAEEAEDNVLPGEMSKQGTR